jgi:diguanylate cyclase (GGDEF)-like protein
MTLARWIPAWIALAAFPLLASAQTASDEQPIDLFDLSAPSFTTFSSRDGVPESVTVAAQTDAQGFVWIASPLGLARYDGRRWSLLDDPALSSSVFDLMLDHAGTLWASFRDRGIAHYDGSHWHVENHATGLPTEHVRRLVETTDTAGRSQLWALTWDDGLLLFRDGHWLEDPGNAQLPRGPVLSLAATHTLGGHERLWIGTYNEGVWFREDGRWQQLSVAHFAPSQIEDLFTTSHDGHEELWISAYGAGLWRLNESGLRSWTMESGDLPTNQVYDIAETALPNGNRAIWVASRSGLIRIYNDRAQVFDRRNGLPSDVIRGLSAWRSPEGIQVLWLATEFGVARTIIGANQWKSATLMGARANGVFNLLVEPSAAGERLWVASTGDGLGLFEQGQWRYFSTADGSLPDTDVRMIKNVPDADGKPQLWVGERYGYLLQVNEGPRFQLVATPWARHVGEAVMDMLSRKVDGVYEQWVVTRQSGLYRQRSGIWTPFRPDSAVGQWRTVKLLEQIDAQGKSWLWVSSNLGLSRFDGERWTLLGRDAGLPDVETSGLTLIPDAQSRQILWIGTAHSGIARMDVSDALHPVMLPADLPPPPDSNAYSAMNDSQGRIFICTNNGVQLLTAKPGGYASQVFTRRDGMVHDECNTNAQFIDAHDRYWTGTLGGVTVFDPEREIRDEHAKPLKITATVIDGVSAAQESAQVPSGAHEVRVDFALLSWQRESESRFRTQLVGYESAPGAWSAQNYRDFSALPPGDYLLRVEARDYAGNLSAPVEFPISVIPTWWQMAWARMLFGLLALLMVYAVLQWRTRSLNAQRRRLEEQVAGRNAELHVANARLLELSYKDALTGLANRRRLLESLEPGASAKMTAGAATALIFVDVDHFKSYNDRFGHPAGDEALRCVAERMQACVPPAALVARYGGEEFACLLPNADTPTARALAEKIRAAVESCDVPLPGTATINRVTISAGVASRQLVSAADAHALLRDADIALYQAKRDGRNCARG